MFVLIYLFVFFFFFKQKTAYEMRVSDWSSDVCSSDLVEQRRELLDDRPAQLLGIHDRHRARIISSHVVTDPDRGQLDRRACFDPADHLPQMAFEIASRIDRQRRIVDRRAEIGRASCRERVVSTCRSRWSPYP